SCPGCPVGCKRKIRTTGRWPAAGPGPEYETLGALGSMLEIADLEAIAYANELCNRAGLDTISLGSTLALATECQERGWLQPEMVGGTRLSWGDATAMVEVVQQAAAGRGLGALVALGSRHLARTLAGTLTDPGARQELMEMAPHVKGLEIPMHDPRANHGMALAYATSYRGACHVSEINFFLEQGAAVFPGLGLEEVCVGTTSEGKARLLVAAQNMTGLACNCLLFCYFTLVPLDETDICAALQAVTGQAWSLPELMEAGERVWMLKRLLNTWRGVRKGDDRLPGRLLRPFDEGPVAGSAPDLDLMRDEFYRLRGLDEHGIPRAETLTRLGLPLSPTERDFGGESGRRLN
ncbi:MAG TPA: aldehyde ferredoxin oxidoreductase, partial [Firmicutes bacterium]|nr:aldehyde ferredoxin oxidoreductase [Bacillota bacterium]